jgi:starch synthase/alpha-amylase
MEASMMPNPSTKPRILFVTAEAAFRPEWKRSRPEFISAHTEVFGDFPVKLIKDLLNMGVDVHVAQPDYRKLFEILSHDKQASPSIKLPIDRVYLAEDRVFFYANPIYHNSEGENIKISLSFQREVINQIVPRIQPDLIHCHDWMTGLIPAMAKYWGIPCLFTVRNLGSAKSPLSIIEDKGIDGAAFWQYLFYDRYPGGYEETRQTNPLDFLLSGILAARHVSTTSFTLMSEVFESRSEFFNSPLRKLLTQKWNAGCACVIPGFSKLPFYSAGHEKPHADYRLNNRQVGKQKENQYMGQRRFSFDDRSAAQRYVDLYETILQRPLVAPEPKKPPKKMKERHTRISDDQAIPHRRVRSTPLDTVLTYPSSEFLSSII